MNPIGAGLDEEMMAVAYQLARRHHLVVEDSRERKIWCWNCGSRPALMPSLHCHICLADARRRLNVGVGLCLNREQTPADVEACRG